MKLNASAPRAHTSAGAVSAIPEKSARLCATPQQRLLTPMLRRGRRGLALLVACLALLAGCGTSDQSLLDANRTALVVIGQDMDHAAVTAALEACLLSDSELQEFLALEKLGLLK